MKKVALLTFVVVCITAVSGYSQTEEGAYLNIDYLKVETEKLAEFEKFVKSKWMPILDSEVSSGDLTACYFYKVVYPGGSLSKYNYVLVRTYQDLDAIMAKGERFNELLSAGGNKVLSESLVLADFQYSELWRTEAGVMNIMDAAPGRYAVVNFMRVKPGMENQYLALENDIARPLHEERINQDKMHNWRTYSLMKPGGANYEFNFITADFYDKVSNIEYGFTNEIMQSVMPRANFTETMNAIINTREIMNSELWKLISYQEK
ncbi:MULTISPECIES: hypothetical protein [Gracilimonas]|uniref:NIPSNAP protein n=1 Tax=Gracilimonas sediminicola TaxID=2952158 RepID=A0A9X2L3N5_9BACT|nr:hypothetical protein [Gracilimonas sediminicola]MCP9291664.1 hypothetical protein [Gracilimonas sediminicola]